MSLRIVFRIQNDDQTLKSLFEYFASTNIHNTRLFSFLIPFFHLNNKKAREDLKVIFDVVQIKHNFTPKYLKITLDRKLTFKEHLYKTGKKLKV